MNEYGQLRRVAVRHPRDLFRSQAEMSRNWRAQEFIAEPDREAAGAEFEAFTGILRNAGADVLELPFDERLTAPAIYTRDNTVMTPRGVVVARMGRPYRSDEPSVNAAALADAGYAIRGEIEAPGFLEGGDVVWFDRQTCAVGQGYRTNGEGIRQLQQLLGPATHVEAVQLPHFRGPEFCLHLMSLISPVDTDLAVIYAPLMAVPFRRWLIDRGVEFVEVPDDEFERQGSNVLAVAPRKVVMVEGCPVTQARLEAAGCEVITFPGEHLCIRGCGGPTCLTRPLARA